MNPELIKEVTFLTSRSSGPGGQHVNKTESKVELHWNLDQSMIISDLQKSILRRKIGNKLTNEGTLILSCQETRSQIKNKEIVGERFIALIAKSLKTPKKRFSTKPTRSSVEKRIQAKKQRSERKRFRGKPDNEL